MLTVFFLTLRQLTGTRRQAILWLFAILPLIFAILLRYLTDDYVDVILGPAISLLLVPIVLPLVVAILATTALGEDVEDRTLSYIVLRPVARWQIVAAKYIAVIVLAAVPLLLLGGATAAVAFVGDSNGESAFDYESVIKPILGVMAGLAIGIVAYSAAFMWLGLISGQALGIAIVYVFVWEGIAAGIFGGIRYLSIRSYSIITMQDIGGERLDAVGAIAGSQIALNVALGGAAAVMIAFLALTLVQLRNMDVP